MITLKLSQPQVWTLLKALSILTSEEGEEIMLRDHPQINLEEMSKEVHNIIGQFEVA